VIKHRLGHTRCPLFPLAMLVIALAAGVLSCASPPTGPERALSVGPQVGKLAPAFSLKDSEGRLVSLSDLKGKPVMINFWATW
jgi:cytochrome c biogenesis protein CcmG, thiol:disulfide interchange protein DsbE